MFAFLNAASHSGFAGARYLCSENQIYGQLCKYGGKKMVRIYLCCTLNVIPEPNILIRLIYINLISAASTEKWHWFEENRLFYLASLNIERHAVFAI